MIKKSLIIVILIPVIFLSCAEVSGHGSLTLILSGSVRGQLDPCG